MNDLSPRITDAVKQLSIEFPKFNFATTRDQTFLLEAGISNLNQDLLYGGALTVALLFLFLGNWSSPALMSINIPLSLIISFVFFYIFHVSFNIISLSGLALGIGMLIDNSIVVIDNINRKQKSGISVEESAVQGTNEVIVPVISQVLTTIAVYAPLLMLNGLAAPLIYDQSIALTISLGVSLLVAFVLSPVLYRLLLKARSGKMKDDTIFFTFLLKNYHRMISHILRRRGVYFSVTLIIMPLGFWLMTKIPVSSLPKIEKKDGLFLIDWNEQVDARENLKRTQHLLSAISRMTKLTEADVGIKQFLLQDGNNAIQNTEIYYSCDDEPAKYRLDELVKKQISTEFPTAVLRIIDAPNAFTQLFVTSAPYFEARFRPTSNIAIEKAFDNMDKLINHMQGHFTKGFGMLTEADIEIRLDYTKMSLYNVSKGAIENTLKQYFGHDDISRIERFSNLETIKLATGKSESLQNMNILITSENGIAYQLNNFLTIKNTIKPKYITADRSGVYQSLSFDTIPSDPSLFEGRIASIAASNGFFSDFKGSYLDDAQQIMNLKAIFLVVLALLYFILAIQYQNLFIPLIVMLTIPLGITGSMFLLWLTGGTLDVMAAIGFVVVLGLIVDDPILKVEVLHRLEKEYLTLGKKFDNELLASMIHEAGAICLKPLLLVSLTTSIAVVPVLFVGGIGNDLQKPLSIVIIGGLTIGTFFTTWFIPLAYWYYINIKLQLKKRIKRNVF
jgi:multidrug efflux pump subunit AcrB